MKFKGSLFFVALVNCLLTLFLVETLLHVYNPFRVSIRRGKVFLHRNMTDIFVNPTNKKLPPKAVFAKNSLGFRGEDPVKGIDSALSILTICGSTTESAYNNHSVTWPGLLESELKRTFNQVWLNNAGMAGHSSFGHLLLLRDYVFDLKPKVLVFLVGVNDLALKDVEKSSDMREAEYSMQFHSWRQSVKEKIIALAYESEIVNIVIALRRGFLAREKNLTHALDFELGKIALVQSSLGLSKSYLGDVRWYADSVYDKRITTITEECLKRGILPVFVTQPALYGKGVDSASGVNLERVSIGAYDRYSAIDSAIDGKTQWAALEIINDRTRCLTQKFPGVLVIDLARQLPKDGRYFYDFIHFSSVGEVAVSKMISKALIKNLRERFPDFTK